MFRRKDNYLSQVTISVMTRLRAGGPGLNSRQLQEIFLMATASRPSLLFNRNRSSFPGVKWTGRDADHSPSYSAEIKNEWSYTFTPPTLLHGVEIYKYQRQLYL
jgi:hypothetical protein